MKTNKEKVITIAALVIAVIGLSIGFAAFSSTLNVSTSAQVTPEDGNFIVKFSKENNLLSESGVVPLTTGTVGVTGATADIDNTNASNPKISNLAANFTAPGQTVEYTFYVRNMGKYDAYLTDVEFNTTGGEFKTCTATGDNPVSNTLKGQICKAIKFTVTLEDSPSNKVLTSTSDFAQAVGNNYYVAKSADPTTGTTNSKMVKVTIEYPSNAPHADGGIEVTFGSIDMIFASLAGYVPPQPTPVNPWTVPPINFTTENAVYDTIYTVTGGNGVSLPETFELLSDSITFDTNDGTMSFLSNNVVANGVTIGSDYILVDVDTYLNVDFGGMCQLYLFDGQGTATAYISIGSTCSYENLNSSQHYNTYSVSSGS